MGGAFSEGGWVALFPMRAPSSFSLALSFLPLLSLSLTDTLPMTTLSYGGGSSRGGAGGGGGATGAGAGVVAAAAPPNAAVVSTASPPRPSSATDAN